MKKLIERMLVLLIAAAVCLSGFGLYGAADPAYAAAKPKLSKKTMTLQPGKTVTLKVKNARKKVKWSTSNKKVVVIQKKKGKRKQKAVLKAKKEGTCIIRAKVGKKVLKCKVTVKKKTTQASPAEPERKLEERPLSDSSKDLSAEMSVEVPADTSSTEAFDVAVTDFSVELLQETLSQDEKNGNLLISPDSVMTALAMTENGAAGTTLAEMESVLSRGLSVNEYNQYLSRLHTKLGKDNSVIYQSANSIWARRGAFTVSQDFLRTNKRYHDASFFEAAFDNGTVKDMNNWVFNKSRNMIDGIIDQLSPMDRIVLINVIAFEGKWAEQIPDNQVNTNGKFQSIDGAAQKVNMLVGSLDKDKKPLISVDGGLGLCKEYQGGAIAFVGIRPPDGKTVNEFVAGLTGDDFVQGWKNRKASKVNYQMPEFKFDYDLSMKDVLWNMGMQEMFLDSADFSRMSESGISEICIDDVLHKTHIELDRNGTKAAAATAVVAKASAVLDPEQAVSVVLDRPFVCALVDTKTGIPLFIGVVKSVK